MGKKLSPSGYVIINLDVSELGNEDSFTPTTDDEILLHEILSSHKTVPILARIKTSGGYELCGMAVLDSGSGISLYSGIEGSSFSVSITLSDDKLVLNFVEE